MASLMIFRPEFACVSVVKGICHLLFPVKVAIAASPTSVRRFLELRSPVGHKPGQPRIEPIKKSIDGDHADAHAPVLLPFGLVSRRRLLWPFSHRIASFVVVVFDEEHFFHGKSL